MDLDAVERQLQAGAKLMLLCSPHNPVSRVWSREELQALIEEAGGRAAGSVSAKTAYLVNNDITSTSGKNKKAKELGVPIVTEEEFLRILKGEV